MLRSLKIPDRRTLHDRSGTRSAYPILIRRDYSGTDDFCAKYRLAEQAAPYRDKAIVHLLGEAVYRETGVAAP